MPFILKLHGHAVVAETPEFFLQAVVEFALPFASQELGDGGAPTQEFGAITPLGVFCVGRRDALGIASIPEVFGDLYFSGRQRGVRKRWGDDFCHDYSPLSLNTRATSLAIAKAPGVSPWIQIVSAMPSFAIRNACS